MSTRHHINKHIKIGKILKQLDHELNNGTFLEFHKCQYLKSGETIRYLKKAVKALETLRSNLEKIMFLDCNEELEYLEQLKPGYKSKIYFGNENFPPILKLHNTRDDDEFINSENDVMAWESSEEK